MFNIPLLLFPLHKIRKIASSSYTLWQLKTLMIGKINLSHNNSTTTISSSSSLIQTTIFQYF